MIRLYVDGDLREGGELAIGSDQTHYLANVMRLKAGDELLAFNGRDGEWRMRLADLAKRGATLTPVGLERAQTTSPDLDLVVAVVKRARLETIAEKAAELGARRLLPVTTSRTNAGRANIARLAAIAQEGAEQTGRLDVPEILAEAKLAQVLAAWPADRRLMFCDEAGDARAALEALAGQPAGPWAILIGPEGGFSPDERAAVCAVPGVAPVSLGPRILRADSAAIAALTLWQAILGDWR